MKINTIVSASLKPLLSVLAIAIVAMPADCLATESNHAPSAEESAPVSHEANSDESGHHAEQSGHATGAHHAAAEIPESVNYQAINFVIYIALLGFFLKKPVQSFFKGREENYSQSLVKAEQARVEAEKKHVEIKNRLSQLEASSDQSISQAKADAEQLKEKIKKEAEELSARLKEDAKRSAALEVERAKTILREELLNQSVQMSQKILNEKMVEGDQLRLQTEFVDKIQEVR
jgi:F-type H+-transporting ATPase subunit b